MKVLKKGYEPSVLYGEGVVKYEPDRFPEGFQPQPGDPPSMVRLNLFPPREGEERPSLALNIGGLLYSPLMFPDLLEAALQQHPELREARIRDDLPTEIIDMVKVRREIMEVLGALLSMIPASGDPWEEISEEAGPE